TYQGFFQELALATERLWSYGHGWAPMSHIRDFGQFYAPMVQLICPLIGFTLFLVLSRHKVNTGCWKPLAVALVLCLPTRYLAPVPVYALAWVEVARTMLVLSLMMWSAGVIRPANFPRDPIRQPAPA